MQIIIPMSGFGERFRNAGYKLPKPLIKVDGRPIISYVVDMFPGEKDFIFICNKEHLNEPSYELEKTLKRYCPSGKIVAIEPHKLGPINAIILAKDQIDFNKKTIVNYCDFTCYWDWQSFKKHLETNKVSGSIPAYKGFHPHSLGSTNYAYIKESNGHVLDIQEKKPFTNNRMNEFASSGTYFFETAKLMFEAFDYVINENLEINGEFYVSLAYKFLLKNNLKTLVFPLQHFMQWGTPEDLSEYKEWSKIFNYHLINKRDYSLKDSSLIIPMAGLGKRFSDKGYMVPKPFINVSGKYMVLNALESLPSHDETIFVVRSDMENIDKFRNLTNQELQKTSVKEVPKLTDGQANTAKIGYDSLNYDASMKTVTFSACDNGVIFDTRKFDKLIKDDNVDVIVWGYRGHTNASRKPEMFGWIKADENDRITGVSVKKPLNNPKTDPIIIGTFTFSKGYQFERSIQSLFDRGGKINGEYYLDSCIEDAIQLGLNCYLFEVDSFISWGTPEDLRTYQYWQSCFHNWEFHEYNMNNDYRISRENILKINKQYEHYFIEESKFDLS